MSDATEITAFIEAQYAADEAAALTASGGTVIGGIGHWTPSPGGDEWEAYESAAGDEELLVALRPGLPRPPDVMGGMWGAVVSRNADGDGWSPMPAFEHMARWDPARVLAEIEAKRAILREHASSEGDNPVCGRCAFHRAAARCRPVPFPCLTVRLLAAPYAGRPGWHGAWAL